MFVFIAVVAVVWLYVAFGPPLVFYVNKLPVSGPMRKARGFAFLMFIFINKAKAGDATSPDECLRHELEHVRQQAIWSPLLFPIMYLIMNAVANKVGLRGMFVYTLANRFEVAARAVMGSDDPIRSYVPIDLTRRG